MKGCDTVATKFRHGPGILHGFIARIRGAQSVETAGEHRGRHAATGHAAQQHHVARTIDLRHTLERHRRVHRRARAATRGRHHQRGPLQRGLFEQALAQRVARRARLRLQLRVRHLLGQDGAGAHHRLDGQRPRPVQVPVEESDRRRHQQDVHQREVQMCAPADVVREVLALLLVGAEHLEQFDETVGGERVILGPLTGRGILALEPALRHETPRAVQRHHAARHAGPGRARARLERRSARSSATRASSAPSTSSSSSPTQRFTQYSKNQNATYIITMKMNNTPTGVASSTVETYCTPNKRSSASRITAIDITSGVPTRNQRCTYTSICSQRLDRAAVHQQDDADQREARHDPPQPVGRRDERHEGRQQQEMQRVGRDTVDQRRQQPQVRDIRRNALVVQQVLGRSVASRKAGAALKPENMMCASSRENSATASNAPMNSR